MVIKWIEIVAVLVVVVAGVYVAFWVPTDLLLKVLAGCGVVALVVVGLFWKYRCRACRRCWAMGKTGRTEGRMPITTMDEWKCKHCGHTVWKKRPMAVAGG